jgi:hypothetical protein
MLFKKQTSLIAPIKKGMYAWNSYHAGSFLLFLQTEKTHHEFLFLPGPSSMNLTFEHFSKAVNENVLEFVEILPDDIYNETLEVWQKIVEQSLNGLESNQRHET